MPSELPAPLLAHDLSAVKRPSGQDIATITRSLTKPVRFVRLLLPFLSKTTHGYEQIYIYNMLYIYILCVFSYIFFCWVHIASSMGTCVSVDDHLATGPLVAEALAQRSTDWSVKAEVGELLFTKECNQAGSLPQCNTFRFTGG